MATFGVKKKIGCLTDKKKKPNAVKTRKRERDIQSYIWGAGGRGLIIRAALSQHKRRLGASEEITPRIDLDRGVLVVFSCSA